MREHTVTQIRVLLEGDERLRGAWRTAMAGGDPVEIYKAMKRLRHQSSEVVDKWDELKMLNQQAARVDSENSALALVKVAISKGYCLVARIPPESDHPSRISMIYIITPNSIYQWDYGMIWRPSQSSITSLNFIISLVTTRDMIERGYSEYLLRSILNLLPPSSYSDAQLKLSIPRFAVITKSALPSNLRGRYD